MRTSAPAVHASTILLKGRRLWMSQLAHPRQDHVMAGLERGPCCPGHIARSPTRGSPAALDWSRAQPQPQRAPPRLMSFCSSSSHPSARASCCMAASQSPKCSASRLPKLKKPGAPSLTVSRLMSTRGTEGRAEPARAGTCTPACLLAWQGSGQQTKRCAGQHGGGREGCTCRQAREGGRCGAAGLAGAKFASWAGARVAEFCQRGCSRCTAGCDGKGPRAPLTYDAGEGVHHQRRAHDDHEVTLWRVLFHALRARQGQGRAGGGACAGCRA